MPRLAIYGHIFAQSELAAELCAALLSRCNVASLLAARREFTFADNYNAIKIKAAWYICIDVHAASNIGTEVSDGSSYITQNGGKLTHTYMVSICVVSRYIHSYIFFN